jgi:hypothetical protein
MNTQKGPARGQKRTRARRATHAPSCDKVRAVAFRIGDRVYEGSAGASHVELYVSLLRQRRVPAPTLEAWTSDERNHGFVTEKGVFINRPEILRRCGAARSQDLRAKGVFGDSSGSNA